MTLPINHLANNTDNNLRHHHDSAGIGRLLVGCAGWSIPREAAAAFPIDGSHLERYARVFSTAEINSSFYRPHQIRTYQRWAASVPEDFRFSVKLPRTMSHHAGLVDIDAPLRQFALEAGALGRKLGCVLVQLPPKLQFDADVAAPFFTRLQDAFACTIACEGRHPSWFGQDARQLLSQRSIVRVRADPAKGQPGPHEATSSDMYVRLHGSPRIYYSSYSDQYLEQLARELDGHVGAGRSVWLVFDNTASGAAVPNALSMVARR